MHDDDGYYKYTRRSCDDGFNTAVWGRKLLTLDEARRAEKPKSKDSKKKKRKKRAA